MTLLDRAPLAAPPGPLIVPSGTGPLTTAAAAWPAASRALFSRFRLGTAARMRYVNFAVGTASGNIQYGLVRLSGAGRTDYTRVADSGVIACPAAGDVRGDIGATALPPGDYAAFLWADNTTFQARTGSNSGVSAHRCSAAASSLASGVPASGSFAWSASFVILSIEGDV